MVIVIDLFYHKSIIFINLNFKGIKMNTTKSIVQSKSFLKKTMTMGMIVASMQLAGCANMNELGQTNGMGSADYSRNQARQYQDVQYGIVNAIRPVVLNGSTTTTDVVGTGVGAILGGVLGNQIGGGRGRDVATVLGVIGGGLVGNAVANNANTQRGLEITVRLDNGRMIAITQADDYSGMRIGDHVRVISGNGVTRVAF